MLKIFVNYVVFHLEEIFIGYIKQIQHTHFVKSVFKQICKFSFSFLFFLLNLKFLIRVGTGKSPDDFVQENTRNIEEWTDQETLLLLKAIETYPDNWETIAEQVGTKTKEQCILHFIRLPIEDHHVDAYSKGKHLYDNNNNNSDSHSSTNPIISLIELLTNSVDPKAASVAYKAVIEYYKNENNDDPMEDIDNSSKSNENNLSVQIKAAAAAILCESKVKASIIAEQEEQEIKSIVQEIIDLQLKKVQLKLEKFEELEKIIESDRREVCCFKIKI